LPPGYGSKIDKTRYQTEQASLETSFVEDEPNLAPGERINPPYVPI